jgi:putative colanic acid biosynthesis acetyltransferase WcaF
MFRKTNEKLDLSIYRRPVIEGQRSAAWRVAWLLVNATIFQSILPIMSYGLKASVLRAFGAKVGRGLIVKQAVNIKYPWLLEIGDHVWIGEGVWIDNPAHISIGSHVCISQGAYLVAGNHDYKSTSFDYFAQPIVISDRCWICAKAILKPGTRLAPGTIVPMGCIWPASVRGQPGP